MPINSVYSYEINVIYPGQTEDQNMIRIDYVMGNYIIKDNKDVYVEVKAMINVKKEILNYSDRFTILFFPERWIKNPNVVTEIKYDISSYKMSKYGVIRKNKSDNMNIRLTVPVNMSDFGYYNYKDYTATFTYCLKNYVFRQGDYYVIELNFPNMNNNMDDSRLINTLTLPYSTSIPYRFPEDVESYTVVSRVSNDEWGNERWTFRFSGSKRRIFWYYDVKEIKRKNYERNILFIILGIFLSSTVGNIAREYRILSFIISAIIALIILFRY